MFAGKAYITASEVVNICSNHVFTFSIKCSRNLTNYQVESSLRLNSETMKSDLLYNLPVLTKYSIHNTINYEPYNDLVFFTDFVGATMQHVLFNIRA